MTKVATPQRFDRRSWQTEQNWHSTSAMDKAGVFLFPVGHLNLLLGLTQNLVNERIQRYGYKYNDRRRGYV